jgi:CheY-like chemotaxis protein
MKKIKILAVDDEKSFLHLYEIFFSHDEIFEVSLAQSIEEARRLIENKSYDVVLMDANFGIDGPIGIKEAIRLKKKYPKMIVAIVSGYGGLLQKSRNVDICIAKPIEDMSALKEILMGHLAQKTESDDVIKQKKNIKLLNRHIGKDYEGFEGETQDGLKIRWTSYSLFKNPKNSFFTLGVSASKGCDGRCFNCLSQEKGLIRELEPKEIISQVFHGLNGFLAFRAFRDSENKKKIKFWVNSTC